MSVLPGVRDSVAMRFSVRVYVAGPPLRALSRVVCCAESNSVACGVSRVVCRAVALVCRACSDAAAAWVS